MSAALKLYSRRSTGLISLCHKYNFMICTAEYNPIHSSYFWSISVGGCCGVVFVSRRCAMTVVSGVDSGPRMTSECMKDDTASTSGARRKQPVSINYKQSYNSRRTSYEETKLTIDTGKGPVSRSHCALLGWTF